MTIIRKRFLSLNIFLIDTLYRKDILFHSGLIRSSSMRLPAGGVFGLISSAGATLKSEDIAAHVAPIAQTSAAATDRSPSFTSMT